MKFDMEIGHEPKSISGCYEISFVSQQLHDEGTNILSYI
jgi:hypothetical protein